MTAPATLRRAADVLGLAIGLIQEAEKGALDDGALAAELHVLADSNPDIVALEEARKDPAGSLDLLLYEKASIEKQIAGESQ